MIKCYSKRIVVVGNAGIGKSYMQLLILLWWARKELRPEGVKWDDFLDSIDVITRVERGDKSNLFFKKERLHCQINQIKPVPDLSLLNSKSTLLLYEPLVSKDEIQSCGIIVGRVWTTVSPFLGRYKEFAKTDCAVKYMKCPDEDELLFMGTVLNCGLADDDPMKPLFKPDSVLERIRFFGPFQRVVLPTNTSILAIENEGRDTALGDMTAEELLNTRNIYEGSTTSKFSVSHQVLRMSPVMDGTFEKYCLVCSSNKVKEKLGEMLFQTDLDNLRMKLNRYNNKPDETSSAEKGTMPTILETFFVKHAIQNDDARWKDWKVATCNISSGSSTTKWDDFTLAVTEMNSTKAPTYDDIKASPGTIFHMSDAAYPFVDYFWYDPVTKTMNAGQATSSLSGHAKTVDTFQKMLKKLDMPDSQKLVINMIPLPSQVNIYASGTTSRFFSNVRSDDKKVKQILETLVFRVIKMVL